LVGQEMSVEEAIACAQEDGTERRRGLARLLLQIVQPLEVII
jgi:hypothetical protein